MQQALFWLAVVTVLGLLAILAELVRGGRSIESLADVPPLGDGEMPAVSIIVPARNEERNVEEALRSVLAQDAPGVEVIVVEDRSDDGTGAILDRMQREIPRLHVVHVTELPPGWLGKNHALQLGADQAKGELLLFTDADIVMAPDTVRRAAAFLLRSGADHVAAGPRVVMPGRLLQAFGVVFSIMFALFSRPWKARDPRSRQHVGIGAFNLIRADAYRRIGRHEPIRMRPDDDMKLGKLVKKHGLRQDFVDASTMIHVEWYASIREAVVGLRKNGFAGIDYRISLVLFSTITHALLFLWPWVALLATHGPTRWLNAAAVGLMLVMFAGAARAQAVPVRYCIAFPVAVLMFLYVVWYAMGYALVHRGIDWRGTHYPLDQLRANRV